MADILIAYCEPFDTQLVTSKRYFIDYLAKQGHRILYLENPPTPLSLIKYLAYYRKRFRHFFRAREVQANVWSFLGVYPLPYHKKLGKLFDNIWVNAVNQWFIRPFIQRALNQLQFHDPIVLLYYPNMLPIVTSFSASKRVLHLVDDWAGMTGSPKSLATLLQAAIASVDCVITSSAVLKIKYASIAKSMHLLRHGVTLRLFEPSYQVRLRTFSEKKAEERPLKIGYYGALHKLNFQLIAHVACQKPEWQFAFYGPLAGLQGLSEDNRGRLPSNVSLHDAVSHDELPTLLNSFDLFWMPFMHNPAMDAMCPIKLFEVCAAGLPAVVSDLKESRLIGEPLGVYFAEDAASHLQALTQGLQTETHDKIVSRHQQVLGYDWDVIAKKFAQFCLSDPRR